MMQTGCLLLGTALDPSAELADFLGRTEKCGGVASFTGITRPSNINGQGVHALFLDHHPQLTLQSMIDIYDAALARFDIQHARIVHRFGRVEARSPIVFAAAAARHRKAALSAVDYIMDRLKTDAIFWKREDGGDGGTWIEPRPDDYAARALWD